MGFLLPLEDRSAAGWLTNGSWPGVPLGFMFALTEIFALEIILSWPGDALAGFMVALTGTMAVGVNGS